MPRASLDRYGPHPVYGTWTILPGLELRASKDRAGTVEVRYLLLPAALPMRNLSTTDLDALARAREDTGLAFTAGCG